MDCSGPKRSAVDGLPEDSLVEILARVPVRSVYRSKCVAKGWRDLIEDPLHGKKIPQTLRGFFSIDKEIYGRGCRGSARAHVGFTSLRARSARLGIDRRLSFLTKLPRIKILTFADSCNGLLLFEHGPKSGPSDRLGYIVCNPATKHWVSVPRYGSLPPPYARGEKRYTYLVFDPIVSSHFHIVQFWFESMNVVTFEEEGEEDEYKYIDDYWELRHLQRYTDVDVFEHYRRRHRRDHYDDDDDDYDEEEDEEEEEEERLKEVTKEVFRISVHVYSSESGTWSHIQSDWEEELGQLEGWRHQDVIPRQAAGCAVLNGMLHFIISDQEDDKDQIVAVDVHGETQRIIPLPKMAVSKPGYVAQSQGHLHYISQAIDAQAQLSIWVLEYTQKWVLKHSVSFVELFGKRKRSGYNNQYQVIGMHPDGNVVFIVQNQKLISYDMDHKLIYVIATLEDNISADHIVPYVPCFADSSALTNKD